MKSIETRTYKSATGKKVSQIRTTNDYLILYLIGEDNSKSTVIDIDVKARKILVKKKAKWEVIAEELGESGYRGELFKTDTEWSRDVAKKL